jgi:hypothetical protein
MNQIPNREFVVDYSTSQIKDAINGIMSKVDNAGFNLSKTSNELMGLFNFHVFKGDSIVGLISGDFSLSLQMIDENKTKILLSGVASPGNEYNPKKIVELQDYLLKMISDYLQGTFNPQAELQKNQGCFGVVVILVAITIGVTALSYWV